MTRITASVVFGVLAFGACGLTPESHHDSQGPAEEATQAPAHDESNIDRPVWLCRPSLASPRPLCADFTHQASCDSMCRALYGSACVGSDTCTGD